MTNNRAYNNNLKPIKPRGGKHHPSNLTDQNIWADSLYALGETASFQGFSGTTEFESFPLRQLFLSRHNRLPSEWDSGYLRTEDVNAYVLKNKQKILASHYHKDKSLKRCLIYLGGNECVYVYLYNRDYYSTEKDLFGVCLIFKEKTKSVEKIMDYFIGLVIPEQIKNEGYLNILTMRGNEFVLEQKEVPLPEIDFNINYNEDFAPINKLIIEKLSVDKSKGIVLLHGKAGTGKTTYIRYLINNIKKKIIYIPPSMADSLANPQLIKFLMTNSNSILVIEDAENVLMKRVEHSSQAIANILNLTDGLLSDCANIQIVATFNTDVMNIDEALLRKGRLIAKYEFKELEEKRALKLCKKLGVENNGKQVLTDIYNANEASFIKEKRKIGF